MMQTNRLAGLCRKKPITAAALAVSAIGLSVAPIATAAPRPPLVAKSSTKSAATQGLIKIVGKPVTKGSKTTITVKVSKTATVNMFATQSGSKTSKRIVRDRKLAKGPHTIVVPGLKPGVKYSFTLNAKAGAVTGVAKVAVSIPQTVANLERKLRAELAAESIKRARAEQDLKNEIARRVAADQQRAAEQTRREATDRARAQEHTQRVTAERSRAAEQTRRENAQRDRDAHRTSREAAERNVTAAQRERDAERTTRENAERTVAGAQATSRVSQQAATDAIGERDTARGLLADANIELESLREDLGRERRTVQALRAQVDGLQQAPDQAARPAAGRNEAGEI